MRTVLFFLFVVFMSTCFLWSSLFTGRDLVSHTVIALGLWALFLYHVSKKMRRKQIREQNEAMFNAYMRERMKRW